MSSWKLVEAEIVRPTNASKTPAKAGGAAAATPSGGKKSNKGKKRATDPRYASFVPPLSEADRNYYTQLGMQQIELLFSTDYLSTDTYLRSFMDFEGFVPVMLVLGYPNVACCGCTLEDIVLCLREHPLFDLEESNLTFRLKDNWRRWLMPYRGPEKGFGLPTKYTLEQQQCWSQQEEDMLYVGSYESNDGYGGGGGSYMEEFLMQQQQQQQQQQKGQEKQDQQEQEQKSLLGGEEAAEPYVNAATAVVEGDAPVEAAAAAPEAAVVVGQIGEVGGGGTTAYAAEEENSV